MDWRGHAGGLVRVLVLALSILFVGFLAGVGASVVASRVGAGDAVEEAASQAGLPSNAAVQVGSASEAVAEEGFTAWDPIASPNYYRVVGSAVVSAVPAPGEVVNKDLDALGRATGAVSLVTYDSMQAGRQREREDASGISPSGWGHNAEVDMAMPDGNVYHGLFFNRSHLLAKSLGGTEEARNLITATRTQNVGANVNGSEGGMAYVEGLARTWLEMHPEGQVYYAATPVYHADELLARSVLVDVRSSDGELDQRIEVYNAALGFDIDYATGSFVATGDAVALAQEIASTQKDEASNIESSTVVPTGSPTSDTGERMVIVTKSGKAYHHDESCRGLVNARSMEWVTVSEAEAMGRHPCGICGG